MTRRIAFTGIVLGVLLGSGPSLAQDSWLGPDKALHFAFSATIAGGGYAGAAFLSDDVGVRLLVGGGLSLSAGALKELIDLAGFGTPSWRDFTWDVIGAATGLLVAWLVDHFIVTPLARPVATP
jgi:putative lipoprotein